MWLEEKVIKRFADLSSAIKSTLHFDSSIFNKEFNRKNLPELEKNAVICVNTLQEFVPLCMTNDQETHLHWICWESTC